MNLEAFRYSDKKSIYDLVFDKTGLFIELYNIDEIDIFLTRELFHAYNIDFQNFDWKEQDDLEEWYSGYDADNIYIFEDGGDSYSVFYISPINRIVLNVLDSLDVKYDNYDPEND